MTKLITRPICKTLCWSFELNIPYYRFTHELSLDAINISTIIIPPPYNICIIYFTKYTYGNCVYHTLNNNIERIFSSFLFLDIFPIHFVLCYFLMSIWIVLLALLRVKRIHFNLNLVWSINFKIKATIFFSPG